MVKDKTLLDFVYPIGSIYFSISSTNPGLLIGGTWTSWGAGRVPVGVDINDSDFNVVEKTGGEKKHTMTIAELAEHDHDIVDSEKRFLFWDAGEFDMGALAAGNTVEYKWMQKTQKTGSNQPFNIQQKYITCYMWKRTA